MFVLGIDGGGTKTKFILVDDKGKFVFETVMPTIHYNQVGLEGLTQNLNLGLQAILEEENIKKEDISYAFVGCPGYGNIEEDETKIKQAVKEALDTIPHSVGNDTVNALSGTLGGKNGIAVIAGTGSIGMGVDDADNTYVSGGWYYTFGGDEGSAAWIAQHYMQVFTKQSDGRLPKTKLYDTMRNKQGFTKDSDLIDRFIFGEESNRTSIASLAIDISELASEGDVYAIKILEEAAYELSLIVRSIYNNLSYSSIVPVSYVGRVVNKFKEYLSDLPVEVLSPEFDPSIGSVLLAFKHSDIKLTKEIISNLQQTTN